MKKNLKNRGKECLLIGFILVGLVSFFILLVNSYFNYLLIFVSLYILISIILISFLLKMNKNLNDKLISNSKMLKNLSHDMKTPLNSIKLIIDDIKFCDDNSINQLNVSCFYLQSLVNNILDLNKLEDNKFTLNNKIFSLNKFIDNLLLIVNYESLKKNIDIQVKKNFDDLLIESDEIRLTEVFVNLLSNAIKYSNDFGTIKFEITRFTDYYEFIIEDNGIGMEKEFFNNIFCLYSRSKRSSKIDGNGIGLFLVHEIIKKLNGEITVDSEVNVGSIFKVRVPLKEINQDNNISNLKVVVVDDSIVNLDVIKKILIDMNKQVIVFDNSISALEYLKNNECDLLFTDINMPNINGKDLSLEIRKINTKIKIIAISGDDLSNFDIFDGFLNKPFSKYDIQNIINKL